MATFYCSVVIPPHRFVNREKVDSVHMYGAFLKIRDKYKPLHRLSEVIYHIEYCGKHRYYDADGHDINKLIY